MDKPRVVFKPFDQGDWMSFSGATSWAEGMPPLIGEIDVGDEQGQVILDREGVSVFWGDAPDAFFVASCEDPEMYARVIALLPTKVTREDLEQLGFSIEKC